jgi:cysteine desulfurase
MNPVYLDYNATTPVDPRVLDAMLPYFREHFGNASSKTHAWGWKAGEAVETARAQVAAILGASPKEIVFTSGATESVNISILGISGQAPSGRPPRNGIVTQATEHHAVLDAVKAATRRGFEATVLPVDAHGRVDPERVLAAVTDRTLLVSIMAANNEVGTLQPLDAIGLGLRERGVVFHVDAAQAVGKVPIDVRAAAIDLLSLSGHKFYGPKGVGALYVRGAPSAPRLSPLVFGGGQERGIRPGTLNVPGIVGLGEACRIAILELAAEACRITELRDRLEAILIGAVPGVRINGSPRERLPGTLSLSFEDVDAPGLIALLGDVAVSSGAACSTGSAEPSHVLRAMGVSPRLALSTLRLSVGRFTTREEVDRAAAHIVERVGRQRAERAVARG